MPSKPFFSYSPKTTSINFPWPPEVTGLERIALSAQGGLQRVLSAFFARPITIALVYSSTTFHPSPDQPGIPLALPNPSLVASASPETPILQTRQVHLQCAGKTVCTATSTVRITSPFCAHLFLEEKYAIGQMFTRMEKVPEFELVSVGFGPVRDDDDDDAKDNDNDDSGAEKAAMVRRDSFADLSTSERKQLWRKYKLSVEDFECDILEVFPDRDMFVRCDDWLNVTDDLKEEYDAYTLPLVRFPRFDGGAVNSFLLVLVAFLFAFELWRFSAGGRYYAAC